MGLDMYLYKRTYIGNNYKDLKDQVKISIANIKQERVSAIIEIVGYWRKANAIHDWFVQNAQEGEDDCKEYYIETERLQKLLDTVNKVLAASKLIDGKIQNGTRHANGKTEPIIEDGKIIEDPTVAKKLLPTTEGFFFGSTDYNQYYIEDLKLTKKILEEAIKEDGEYYYRSSW